MKKKAMKKHTGLIAASLPLMVATVLAVLIVLFTSYRGGLPEESPIQDFGELYRIVSEAKPVDGIRFATASSIIQAQSRLHGHDWVTRTVREASFPSDAPWRRMIGRIAAPEPILDQNHPVLMNRINGILSSVAQAAGSYPEDFEVHITGGRQISAYSMADGSIYLSYMLVASLSDDEIAFAIAHEIRHLRACHYKIEGGFTWELEEWHAEAFSILAGEGYGFLLEPSDDYYSQEAECDAYATFIIAFCGFDPKAGTRLVARLPEGDGILYPRSSERIASIEKLVEIIGSMGFSKRFLPLFNLKMHIEASIMEDAAQAAGLPAERIAFWATRDAAALDLLMAPQAGIPGRFEESFGLLASRIAVRLEASAKNAVTADVAIAVSSNGISAMESASIVMRALMLNTEGGWEIAGAFDSSGRISLWNAWTRAEDKLPHSKPSEPGEMKFALDALAAWKASFTIDPGLHVMCYSMGGVEPYFENESSAGGFPDLLVLSSMFSSLANDAEMRIFDINARRQGNSFVSVGFVFVVAVNDIPILVGNARLGMVPERGGWAVAGVSLY